MLWPWTIGPRHCHGELPIFLTSTSVSKRYLPSNDVSESTWIETINLAVSGNCSEMSIFAPRYLNRNSIRAYQTMH
ncbi:3-phosphoshikimate 1-carboxyvinyltransferase [Psidium guajava]|nr:3-phosphoshikimate 1-carboxyvinyltransferase [Psidium guajava]